MARLPFALLTIPLGLLTGLARLLLLAWLLTFALRLTVWLLALILLARLPLLLAVPLLLALLARLHLLVAGLLALLGRGVTLPVLRRLLAGLAVLRRLLLTVLWVLAVVLEFFQKLFKRTAIVTAIVGDALSLLPLAPFTRRLSLLLALPLLLPLLAFTLLALTLLTFTWLPLVLLGHTLAVLAGLTLLLAFALLLTLLVSLLLALLPFALLALALLLAFALLFALLSFLLTFTWLGLAVLGLAVLLGLVSHRLLVLRRLAGLLVGRGNDKNLPVGAGLVRLGRFVINGDSPILELIAYLEPFLRRNETIAMNELSGVFLFEQALLEPLVVPHRPT